MRATIGDLRYRMNDVLKALDRNESVSVLYRGKVKGVLRPAAGTESVGVKAHPFFGCRTAGRPVAEVMDELRAGRVHDL